MIKRHRLMAQEASIGVSSGVVVIEDSLNFQLQTGCGDGGLTRNGGRFNENSLNFQSIAWPEVLQSMAGGQVVIEDSLNFQCLAVLGSQISWVRIKRHRVMQLGTSAQAPTGLYACGTGPVVPALRVTIPGALQGKPSGHPRRAALGAPGGYKPRRGLQEYRRPAAGSRPLDGQCWPMASKGRSARAVSLRLWCFLCSASPCFICDCSQAPPRCKGKAPPSPHPVPPLRCGLRLPGWPLHLGSTWLRTSHGMGLTRSRENKTTHGPERTQRRSRRGLLRAEIF